MNRRSRNYSTTTILHIVVFAHLHCKKEEGLDIIQHLGNSFLFFLLITLHISSPRLPKHSIALPTGHIIISVFLFSLYIHIYTAQIFFFLPYSLCCSADLQFCFYYSANFPHGIDKAFVCLCVCVFHLNFMFSETHHSLWFLLKEDENKNSPSIKDCS